MYRKTRLLEIALSLSVLLPALSACGGCGYCGARIYATTKPSPPAEQLQETSAAFAIRIIYFEFDSSRVRPQFDEVLAAHADYLLRNPEARAFLEGHTDERGSREYNLALGERRSLSVRQQLLRLGGRLDQLRTTSYGEEQPAVDASGESAWAKNRRVEIRY